MAMKPIKLLAPMGMGFKRSLSFKWQYRVRYEMYVGDGRWQPSCSINLESRSVAREYVRVCKRQGMRRKFITERRLVETRWEGYSDSFGWNAGRPSA